jgi:hypothetical protein
MRQKLRLIVMDAIAESPFAGTAWQALHYIEGLRRLGHEVFYIDDSNQWPHEIKGPNGENYATDFIARTMAWCGMEDHWAYREPKERGGRIFGMSEGQFQRVFNEADALINVTVSTVLREEHMRVPVRVYLETDPGHREIKSANGDPLTMKLIQDHTHRFSFAENLGAPVCALPTGPFTYHFTRQPIVLDWFTPPTTEARNGKNGASRTLRFTTVANWKQTWADVEWKGERYTWSKHTEFLKFIDLPRRLGFPVELALSSIDRDSVELLASRGWPVADAISLSTDILPYRDYIFGSDGEFTVAKDQNVRLRTGWFSDRSASYLTAGKPVITQDTGFGTVLPTGEGLFAFDTMDEILAAFEAIQSDYARHSRAAQEIAEEYFRAETVLERLLQDAGL